MPCTRLHTKCCLALARGARSNALGCTQTDPALIADFKTTLAATRARRTAVPAPFMKLGVSARPLINQTYCQGRRKAQATRESCLPTPTRALQMTPADPLHPKTL